MVKAPLIWIAGSPLTDGLHQREVDIARRTLEELEAEHPATTPAPKEPDMATAITPAVTPAVVDHRIPRLDALQQAHNELAAKVSRLSTDLTELEGVVLDQVDVIKELTAKLTALAEQGPKVKAADDTNDRLLAYLRDNVPGVWMSPTAVGANLGLDGKSVAARLDRLSRIIGGGVERQGGRGSGAHPLYRVVPPPKPQPES